MLGCIFAFAVTIDVGGLFSFHAYLTLTGQSTIEFMSNRKLMGLMRRKFGDNWRIPSDKGMKKNWQILFRAFDNLWFISWCMPRLPNSQHIILSTLVD